MIIAILSLSSATLAVSIPNQVPAYDAGPWGAWAFQTIDTKGSLHHQFVAVDSHDQPHLAWGAGHDSVGQPVGMFVAYAVRVGLTWQVDHIMSTWAAPQSLALDSVGNPHMTIAQANLTGLYYASRDDGGWHIETIEATTSPYTSNIALDAARNVYVQYYGTLAIRNVSSGQWRTEVFDSSSGISAFGSGMTIESDGTVQITYGQSDPTNCCFNAGLLRHAVRAPSGTWSLETIRKDCGEATSIAVDPSLVAHIACFSVNDGLIYATRATNGPWTFEQPDPTSRSLPGGVNVQTSYGAGYLGTSIKVNQEDVPVIAYSTAGAPGDDPTNMMHPRIATKTIDGWQYEEIEMDGDGIGGDPSLAIDSAGRPHVTYSAWWTLYSRACSDPLTHCFDTMYAEPAIALSSALLDITRQPASSPSFPTGQATVGGDADHDGLPSGVWLGMQHASVSSGGPSAQQDSPMFVAVDPNDNDATTPVPQRADGPHDTFFAGCGPNRYACFDVGQNVTYAGTNYGVIWGYASTAPASPQFGFGGNWYVLP